MAALSGSHSAENFVHVVLRKSNRATQQCISHTVLILGRGQEVPSTYCIKEKNPLKKEAFMLFFVSFCTCSKVFYISGSKIQVAGCWPL